MGAATDMTLPAWKDLPAQYRNIEWDRLIADAMRHVGERNFWWEKTDPRLAARKLAEMDRE